MKPVVVLDSGPLGLLTHRGGLPEVDACQGWLADLLDRNVRVLVPEIVDYEIRRELLRARKIHGIRRLDTIENLLEYLPLTTPAIRRAAELWAQIRQQGMPLADPHALDGDVILAAQALTLPIPVEEIVVATMNVKHLERLLPATHWQDLR
jgi:predicted nucleic acid-binding protein